MSFNTGGVKAVHYSNDGTTGSWTQISGDVTRVDGLEVEPINQEHTAGDYQSGDSHNPTFYFNDDSDYSTVRGFAVGASRAKKYIAIEFFDGRILKTKVGVYLKVMQVPKAQRSEGDSEWGLSYNHQADEMLEDIASLT